MRGTSSRRGLTFSQAEGLAPIPQQLAPKQLDERARTRLWTAVYHALQNCVSRSPRGPYVGTSFGAVLADYASELLNVPPDEFTSDWSAVQGWVKPLILERPYNEIFDFLQFMIQHEKCPSTFTYAVADTLEETGTAYRVVDDDLIVPVASDSDAEAIRTAFDALGTTQLNGARTHLRQAAEQLGTRDWGRAVSESMNAVESVVRMLTEAGTLGEAIKKLDKAGAIHGSLKVGLDKLYG